MAKQIVLVCICLFLAGLCILLHPAVPFGGREATVQYTAAKIHAGTWHLTGEEYLKLFSDREGKQRIVTDYYSPVKENTFAPDFLPFHAATLAMASSAGGDRITVLIYLLFVLICLLSLSRIVLKNSNAFLIVGLVFFSPALWVALYRYHSSGMLLTALVTGLWTCCLSAENSPSFRKKTALILVAGLFAGTAVLMDTRYALFFFIMLGFITGRGLWLKWGKQAIYLSFLFFAAGLLAIAPLCWYAAKTSKNHVLSLLEGDLGPLRTFYRLWHQEPEGIPLDDFPPGTAFRSPSQRIEPETAPAAPLLVRGWSVPESMDHGEGGFVWCQGRQSAIQLYLQQKRDTIISMRLLPFTFPDAPPQTVDLFIGQTPLGRLVLQPGWHIYDIPVEAHAIADFPVILTCNWGRAVSPREAGLSKRDSRPLAAAVDYLTVRHPAGVPVSNWPHFFSRTETTIHRSKRKGFHQPCGSILSVPVRIPPGPDPVLHAFLGASGREGEKHPRGPVRCRILVQLEDSADRVMLMDKSLDPAANPHDRFWIPINVSLSRYAGREARLEFQVTPLSGAGPAWPVVWAQPRLHRNPPPPGIDMKTTISAEKVFMNNLLSHPQRLLLGIPLLLFVLPGYFAFRNRDDSKIFPLLYWIGSVSFLAFFSYTPVLRHFSSVTSLYLPILPAVALLSTALLEKMKTGERLLLLLFLALFTLCQFAFFLCKMGVDPFRSGILASMNKDRVMFFSIYEKAE